MYKNNNNIKIETNISPYIFTKKTNTSYKLVPFNVLVNNVGKTKYLPPVSKEWKNSIYNYYTNNIINLPVYDLNVNSLIKGYFSLYFNHKFLGQKYISPKKIRKSFNRIFVSKAEIKHTNNKAIITIYVYNKERSSLLNKINRWRDVFFKTTDMKIITNKWLKFYSSLIWEILAQKFNYWSLAAIPKAKNSKIYWKILDRTHWIIFSKKVRKIFSTIRRLKLKLSLNRFKFEEKFLSKLSLLISKYYGKKVEFNIVNLKSVSFNSDIFTEILTLKLKKEKSSPMFRIKSLLSKVVLSKVNTITERGRIKKQVDFELIENKYRNLNLNYIINKVSQLEEKKSSDFFYAQPYKDNLNKLLYNLYYKPILDSSSIANFVNATKNKSSKNLGMLASVLNVSSLSINKAYYLKLRNIILENIKYKTMGGARLSVKGRLTRRYRADRAVYKLKWIGGLKNIDSSFKGLSSVIFRGYLDSNVEKTRLTSKRRIGSFAVKGWFSGK